MKEPFEEIRITDLDVDLTQPSQEAPGFRRLYLKLSEEPSPKWVRIFERGSAVSLPIEFGGTLGYLALILWLSASRKNLSNFSSTT